MNLDEFESQYYKAMDEILNQLQTINLLLTQADVQIAEVRNSVQRLSLSVETYINEKKAE